MTLKLSVILMLQWNCTSFLSCNSRDGFEDIIWLPHAPFHNMQCNHCEYDILHDIVRVQSNSPHHQLHPLLFIFKVKLLKCIHCTAECISTHKISPTTSPSLSETSICMNMDDYVHKWSLILNPRRRVVVMWCGNKYISKLSRLRVNQIKSSNLIM